MINYICNTNSNEIFVTRALDNDKAIFVPKLMHTGQVTIIDYISFGKEGFSITDIQPIFNLLEIKDPTLPLSSLPAYKQMLIHYFSHLIIAREEIFIELPQSQDMTLLFIDLLFQMIELIDFSQRQLIIISNDSRVTSRNLKQTNPLIYKMYSFKPTCWLILKAFIAQRATILVSLLLTISIIVLCIQIDQQIIDDQTKQLLVPPDLVVIQNNSSSCKFNQYSYNIDIEKCPKDDLITYSQLKILLEDERVEAVYFDDKEHLLNLSNDIATNSHLTASFPDSNLNLTNALSTLACVDSKHTTGSITCEQYNPDSSMISKATKDNFLHLQQNISFDSTSSPNYIFLDTNQNNTIAKTIAINVPSISVYTAFTIQKYIFHANLQLLSSVLIIGSIASIVIAVSFFSLITNSGISIRGLRYRLIFQTGRPLYVKSLYYISQIIYFGTLITIGSFVTINNTHSYISFGIGLYFGIINSILWIILATKLSPVFSGPENQLLKDISVYKHKQNVASE